MTFIVFTANRESCDGLQCAQPHQLCTIASNNKVKCVCPQYTCLEEDRATVCGTDNKTYDSPCEMESYACYYNMNITVAHQGQCKGMRVHSI